MRTTNDSPSSKPSLDMSARMRTLTSGMLRSDSVTARPHVGIAGQAMLVRSMPSRSTTSLQQQRMLSACVSAESAVTKAVTRELSCVLLYIISCSLAATASSCRQLFHLWRDFSAAKLLTRHLRNVWCCLTLNPPKPNLIASQHTPAQSARIRSGKSHKTK